MTQSGRTPTSRIPRLARAGGAFVEGHRIVPTETAVALTYNGSTHAVMMATPADLEDFAIGFSLSEGVIEHARQINEIAVVESEAGIDLQMWLTEDRAGDYVARRRAMTGPTGCGLCGIESLQEAVKPVAAVSSGAGFTAEQIVAALATLSPAQRLNAETRAVHGAACWEPGRGLIGLREDVGRHNALDKLAGHLARSDVSPARGILLLTSRVSVEMVQKAARMGAPVIVAVSVPTSLAVDVADEAGITLIAVARGEEFEIFTRPDRVSGGVRHHVA